MPTTYTGLLGLAIPQTGELSGTWGDTVNDYITRYLDAAIAGAQTISGNQTAVTLSTTNGSTLVSAGAGATGSAQYSIINCTGNPATTLVVTVPTASKVYLVLNATSTSQSVTVKPSGAAGITVASNRAALIAWNGSDFVRVATNDLGAMTGTISLTANVAGTLPVGNGGTGVTTSTGSGANVLSTSPALTTPNLGTPSAATLTNATGLPLTTGTTGTLSVNKGGTGDTTYTNGQLLIGNTTGNTLTKATLTAGTGISITNGAGAITVASTAPVPGGQSFTSSGTFTIPTGVTAVKVTLIGGGGGSGGAVGTAATCCSPATPGTGGGGGGGGSAVVYLSSLTPGNTIGVTVGAAGTAGAAAGNGGAGGNSQISSGTQSITTVTAAGGGAGLAGNDALGAGGAGGTTTNATWGVTGRPGGYLAGGDSILGFGGVVAAQAGSGYGGGAAGGGPVITPSVSGYAGAAGFVLFEW